MSAPDSALVVRYAHNEPGFLLHERKALDARLREAGPIHWSTTDGGFWIAVQPDCVREVLIDHARFGSKKRLEGEQYVGGVLIPPNDVAPAAATDFDRPEHSVHRELFAMSGLYANSSQMAADTEALLSGRMAVLSDRDEFDLVTEAVFPLVQRLYAEYLGLDDFPLQDVWLKERLASHLSNATLQDGYPAKVLAALDGDPAQIPKTANVLSTLFGSGIDTTVSLIIWSTLGFLTAERHGVRSVEQLINQSLVRNSPFALVGRTVRVGGPFHGVELVEGQRVLVSLQSANERSSSGRFSFGQGIHSCPGKSTAVAVANAALGAITSVVDASDWKVTVRPFMRGTLAGFNECVFARQPAD